MKTSKQTTCRVPLTSRGTPPGNPGGLIHPVLIYPLAEPASYEDLKALFSLVARLDADREHYARPITVLDRKTEYALQRNRNFARFMDQAVRPHSDVLNCWSVDTCQMWYTGLGHASDRGAPGDVYWLIPGDFNYGSSMGREVLERLHDLPEIVLELDQDLCIGEIATDHCNPKQLIDTYGTFALLYNWFPAEAQEIRRFTERPRSEFFAVRHEFLQRALNQRWYPYEQTVVMLLQAVFAKGRISRFFVGNITDLPEGKEPLTAAIQQVERTERVLKAVWRDRNHAERNWPRRYRDLETRSDSIRQAALTVLENGLVC